MLKKSIPEDFEIARKRMVREYIVDRGITHHGVISVMSRIPRHRFVDDALADQAYSEAALSIGDGQTISQPYVVALMTQSLELESGARILEIGTGSGYQTAVLAELGYQVYTIERIEKLAEKASHRLKQYSNVFLRCGDGTQGWSEVAPFDGILSAASSHSLPQPWCDQLRLGGVLIMPMGNEDTQNLFRFRKMDNGLAREDLGPCRFVRLIGSHGWKQRRSLGTHSTPRAHHRHPMVAAWSDERFREFSADKQSTNLFGIKKESGET